MLRRYAITALVALACFVPGVDPAHARGVDVSGLWYLSDFNGPIRYNSGPIDVDADHDETIWLTGATARVFNAQGMEVYDFEVPVRGVIDLAKVSGSDMVALSVDPEGSETAFVLTRLDYRGRVRSTIEATGFPDEFSNLEPNRLDYRSGKLYLVSMHQSRVAVLDESGRFLRGHDLTAYVDNSANLRSRPELGGFAVAADGAIAFTVPLVDGAYLLMPDGTVREWGRGGSIAGSFGVVGGIAIDDDHRTYVLDSLRAVILCFDEDQKFVREFDGSEGSAGSALVFPRDITIDRKGRLYVTQMGMRGAAVFAADWE